MRVTNDKKTISTIKQSFFVLGYYEMEDVADDILPSEIEI